MDDLRSSDTGYYTCKASNKFGEAETTGILMVKNGKLNLLFPYPSEELAWYLPIGPVTQSYATQPLKKN